MEARKEIGVTETRMPTPEEIRFKENFTPMELGVFLGCGRTAAYKLLQTREIPSFTVGRLRRVRRQDAEAYIVERTTA